MQLYLNKYFLHTIHFHIQKWLNIQTSSALRVLQLPGLPSLYLLGLTKQTLGYMKSVCLKMCINTTEKLVLYKTYKVSENKINYEKALYRKRFKMEN